MQTIKNWKAPSQQLLFSRQDPEDLRWGDLAKITSPFETPTADAFKQKEKALPTSPGSVGLWGYADDQGIALNGGRTGASFAPDTIRRFFYRITPPLAKTALQAFLYDYGNWGPHSSLEAQIHELSPRLAEKLQLHPMITLGGGHDYGAVDGAGFLQWFQAQQNPTSASPLTDTPGVDSKLVSSKPLIINFDAHLDVRPWKKGLNSGTPFSWLLENYANQFEFIEIGIQKHCSSPHHHQWLQSQKASVISLDYIRQVGILAALHQVLAGTSPQQACFISMDIDVFSQSLAPGCSQSWDAGLTYEEVHRALQWLMTHKQVRLLGIYEVSPPLDIDHRTSKLAACLMDNFLRVY